MKKLIAAVAFCLLSLSLFSQTDDVLSLQDAIALYEDDSVIEIIKDLVAESINATDNDNYTALIYASEYGLTEIVKSLIAEGADIESKNNSGETALRAAIGDSICGNAYICGGGGYTEIVKLLIEAEADIDVQNNSGETTLYKAVLNGDIEMVKVLTGAGARNFGDAYNNDSIAFLMMLAVIWVVFGAVVFGFYYLLYKLTIKTKGTVRHTSFVVRAPFIIGWINLFTLAVFLIFTYFFTLYRGSFLYPVLLAAPLSIGSLAISFEEYKKKLITNKKLRIIILVNIISIVLCLWYGSSSLELITLSEIIQREPWQP